MKHIDIGAAVLFGAASLQGFLCALFFLFTKKGSRYANRFMLAMITCITLIIFQNFMIFFGAYVNYPKLIFIFFPLNGLIAPLFFFYVMFLISPNRKMKLYDLLHLIICFVMLYRHIDFLMLPDDVKISVVNYYYYENTRINPSELPRIIFFKLIAIGYGLACFYVLKKKILELKQWTSNTNIQYLNNFKPIVYLFLAYNICLLAVYIYPLWYEVTVGRYEVYIHILKSLIILLIAILTMQQPERLVFLLKKMSPLKVKKQYDFSVFNNLDAFMNTEKPFLNPDLKLHDLAKLIGAPAHLLSEYINKKRDLNFFEFINHYRVNEFKQRVHDSEYKQYTLLAIALDVGFNSKASFNRIFKQHTRLTPSQFKKQK